MRRRLLLTLLVALGAATACDVDEPTAPASAPARPEENVVVAASLATVLGRATVEEQGTVGTFTSLVSSSDGAQRIAYRDETNQRLKYAACSANCTVAANWQQAVIDQASNAGYWSTLRVQSGVRHVLYANGAGIVQYARCGSECLLEGSWIKGAVASLVHSPALAIGGSGRLHMSLIRQAQGDLVYATCLTNCTSYTNWEGAIVDPHNSPVPQSGTSIVVTADGRRHISYERDGQLRYATCLASCTNAANWQFVTADQSPASVGYRSSLAVDANGVRRISYYDRTNRDLKFARCVSNCANPSGWARVTVDPGASVVGGTSSLAVGGDGKVHVSYHDATAGRLKYAICAANCLLASSWERQSVDGGCNVLLLCTNVGQYSSLRLGGGKVHVSYYNVTKGNLKYAQLTQ